MWGSPDRRGLIFRGRGVGLRKKGRDSSYLKNISGGGKKKEEVRLAGSRNSEGTKVRKKKLAQRETVGREGDCTSRRRH